VYAEDPYRGFLPSTGRLARYRPPAVSADVRVDDGVVEGSEISMFYDPMIAKLISYGPDRLTAIDAQIGALDRFEIDGIGHNIDFLSALMQHPRFRSGVITTGFIAEEYPDGFVGAPAAAELTSRLAAVAALIATAEADRAGQIDGQLNGGPDVPTTWVVTIDGIPHAVEIEGEQVTVDGTALVVDARYVPGQRLVEAVIDGATLAIRVTRKGNQWRFTTRGASHRIGMLRPAIAALSRHMIEKVPPDLSRFLLCPMPGLVTAIHVAAGDAVEAGQPLAVVEAMKMENILRAEKAGTVARVDAKPGESLAVDAVILEFA
ncbi:MAG TPA: biotin/lipoyl-containing protein, partial [Sphingomonas sp.]|uniref:biotin/lipoyl-containing protein n=1 Tax=Sphingomonas sp. TaxID=28214 RepID=UPI002ED87C25